MSYNNNYFDDDDTPVPNPWAIVAGIAVITVVVSAIIVFLFIKLS